MRRAVALGVALAALATAGPAHATFVPGPGEDVTCGPGERWCVGVFNMSGRRTLTISGFDLRGRYRVCVTPPKAKESCRAFALVVDGRGVGVSNVRLAKHFPHSRRGIYQARWIYRGKQLGRSLKFPFPGLK